MKIKITPLTTKESHIEGEIKYKNNFYFAKFHYAGLVTEIKKSDNWLEGELAWISRSEIPFLTAIRHFQFDNPQLVAGAAIPILRRFNPFYKTIEVKDFPSSDICKYLIGKYCDYVTDNKYKFYKSEIDFVQITKTMRQFDYKNNLTIRAGTCLYKAYCLLSSSHTFAEEIYTNAFIALEAIIKDLQNRHSNSKRKIIVELMAKFINANQPGCDFVEYEDEMRDGIRNDIIHPYRDKFKKKVSQPFLMADYIFEDLAFIDWIFKNFIEGKFD